MNKIIEIIEPSKNIFDLYNYFEEKIRKAIPNVKTRLIGSFAIPMCGKKEIDILVEIDDVKRAQIILEKLGFSKGPIIRGEGFSHDRSKDMICELHILPPNDKRIKKVYDKVINTLRENKNLREKFEKLKRSLNGKSEEEYKIAKSNFLAENIFGVSKNS